MDTGADRPAGARGLPPLQRLLERDDVAVLVSAHARAPVVDALRDTLDRERAGLLGRPGGVAPDPGRLVEAAARLLAARARPALRRVINATGIVLHTNLGRSPLAPEAAAAVASACAGYCNLEYDLEAGRRGGRLAGIEALLRRATGAEAAVAVNNNAAATLLAIAAVASGGEVVVSRGELVEIGGGFRIPDVIRQGGAALVEVGTTNRTRLSDYRDAITPRTRALLKVHQSNYRIVGFASEVPAADLASLARAHGLPLVHDLGSGCLTRPAGALAAAEPTVGEALRDGADLVTFSADKLLGGPQAGVIAGAAARLDAVRAHPLLRAVRLDKLSAAALEATLALHADPGRARRAIPALRMLGDPPEAIERRAGRLLALLRDDPAGRGAALLPGIVATEGRAGGGTLPCAAIDSRAVAVALDPDGVLRLRRGVPAVVGLTREGRLLLDLLAVGEDELAALADAVLAAAVPDAAAGPPA